MGSSGFFLNGILCGNDEKARSLEPVIFGMVDIFDLLKSLSMYSKTEKYVFKESSFHVYSGH